MIDLIIFVFKLNTWWPSVYLHSLVISFSKTCTHIYEPVVYTSMYFAIQFIDRVIGLSLQGLEDFKANGQLKMMVSKTGSNFCLVL